MTDTFLKYFLNCLSVLGWMFAFNQLMNVELARVWVYIWLILKLLWLLWDLWVPVALNVKQHGGTTEHGYTVRARRQKQTPERRPRCVTFQRSEVRAPLFPIQPMLWVLFQKVLSLANGPWSHKHRDRVQRTREGGQRGPDSQETEEGRRRKRES